MVGDGASGIADTWSSEGRHKNAVLYAMEEWMLKDRKRRGRGRRKWILLPTRQAVAEDRMSHPNSRLMQTT